MLLGTVLVLLVFSGSGTASAHAALRGADPEDGTVLKSAPRHISLTFTESVGLLDDSFRVIDPRNKRLELADVQHVPDRSDTVRATLPPKLTQGTYVVSWRVVSADSHPISGAFTFSVGKPSPTPPAIDNGPVEDPATAGLYNIARYLAYLAFGLLLGTAVFVAVCRPPDRGPLRRPLWAALWTLLGATIALLVLRAPYESGVGPASAFDASGLERTVTTRPGVMLLLRLALLSLAAFFLVRLLRRTEWSRGRLAAGAVLSVGLALTWAGAEHASAGIQVPVAMTSAVLHVLAMAVWLGGLAALLLTLYRSSAVPPAMVARFSRLAFTSVTVLVVTGVYQSWRGLGSFDALTGTSYGRLLTAKLAAVVLLLTVASLSRRWTARLASADVAGDVAADDAPDVESVASEVASAAVVREQVSERVSTRVPEPVGGGSAGPSGAVREGATEETGDGAGEGAGEGTVRPSGPAAPVPEDSAPEDPRRRGLRRAVLAEVGVGFVVLVLSTVLSGTLPGRAAAEAAQSAQSAQAAQSGGVQTASVTTIPFDTGTPGGYGKAQITLIPGAGAGEYSVEAVVYGPDGGLSSVPELRLSFTLPAQDIGPLNADLTDKGGYWATDALTLPIAGDWTMKVTVRISEIDQASETKKVRLGGR
ncbi:copper resistance CopC/CopD family protein [Streptomyces cellulosae]|uniref:copper resistance CopC/CopD family protein n=1 Tax=Streptomyces cellulosae TaxID=1968 RepID=UPI0004C8FB74|nr:copper resistance protein CopC [Streptomyces cellulosae]